MLTHCPALAILEALGRILRANPNHITNPSSDSITQKIMKQVKLIRISNHIYTLQCSIAHVCKLRLWLANTAPLTLRLRPSVARVCRYRNLIITITSLNRNPNSNHNHNPCTCGWKIARSRSNYPSLGKENVIHVASAPPHRVSMFYAYDVC